MTRDEIKAEFDKIFQQFPAIVTFERAIDFAEHITKLVQEECAKVCDAIERRKWETLTTGGELSGFSALACSQTIRASGKK